MRLHTASLRLAGLYLAIIMVISLFFSGVVYQLSIHEVYQGLQKQEDLIERSPNVFLRPEFREELYNQHDEQYENVKAEILGRLVIVNLSIFIAGGFISYYFARRTIRPIEEAHEAQSRFTADASHELRTPLAVMQSETEVSLMDPKLNLKSAKKQLRSNLEELAKLTSLSEGLLQLSQLEEGGLDKKPVAVKTIIDNAVKNHQKPAVKKKVKLNILSATEQKIFADPISITQAIGVLIDNAIKYSPYNREVSISATAEDKHIKIEVIDHGIGINPAEIKYIFDRFYRADSARTKSGAGGYGLGLSIARSIVKLHNGSIKADSVPGKRTVFSVVLPKA